MDDLDEYQNRRKAAEARRRRHCDERKAKSVRKGSWWKRFIIRSLVLILIVTLFCASAGIILVSAVVSKYQHSAEAYDLSPSVINNLAHPSIIFDRNGREIGRIYDENRSYVEYKDIAPCMIDALVAQEDKNFWTHKGYDPMGILRASKEALAAGGSANQGASTITQQLARGAYDLESRTQARGGSRYQRKIIEIFLAMRIEERYSKHEIMEFYLNRIYFGNGFYGIRAASKGYFGKEPADLTIEEAASIAALIKNPENYNPICNLELNKKWRNDVLDRMQRLDYLTEEEAANLKRTELVLNPQPIRRQTSHLHALVQQQAVSLFKDPVRGEEIIKKAGIKIYTTIDKDMQDAAMAELDKQLLKIEDRPDYKHVRFKDPIPEGQTPVHNYLDGAVYAVDNRTGATLVYVGGRSFTRSNYDIIESGRRPIGTALLPFLYLCAFDNGFSPCYRVVDDALDNRLAGIGGTEGILGEWGMESPNGRYVDSVTLRQALSESKIAAATRLGIALSSKPGVGCKPFMETLLAVGITPPPRNASSTEVFPQYYPRVYLGTEPVSLKQMVSAYTVFPNAGKRIKTPFLITKITVPDRDDPKKEIILWEHKENPSRNRKAEIKPCSAFRVHSILKDSMQSGAPSFIRSHMPASFKGAVKSGTNYDYADASLFAYDSAVTCGIWVGFLNNQSAIYHQAFGSEVCAPIMGEIFKAKDKGGADGKLNNPLPNAEILPPDDTEEVHICSVSGQRATNHCYKAQQLSPHSSFAIYSEYFPKGDTALSYCSVHSAGAPSLGDFMVYGGGHTGSTKVLPILPILPKSEALVGDDPYACDLKLSPRYANEEDLAQYREEKAAESLLPNENDSRNMKGDKDDATIKMEPPRPMIVPPLLPFEL